MNKPNHQEIVDKTAEFVRGKMEGEASGHDWWHVYRVWKTATHIGKEEKADLFLVELAALLHDIADWKFNDGDLTAGARVAREWLEKQGVDEKVIAEVCHVVENVSYKGAGEKNSMQSEAGKIVQDADRLDALGAIGIGRVFAYTGNKNRPLHDPHTKSKLHTTQEEYFNNTSPAIHHFHEKLLLLKDRMNTKTARKIAEKRHEFMEEYLERFHKEWEGEQ